MVRSAKGVTFGCSQRRVAAFRVAGVLPSNPKKELTIHVRRLCLLTGRPGCPTECHWIAPVLSLQQQLKPKNKRIQGQANLQKIREGREEVTVAGRAGR